MDQTVRIDGEVLAKNTIFNFLGQLIPLLVALFAIPYIIRGLGPERFGVFSLIWVVVGYFSLFDFGLGRASTRFVAEALGKGETKQVPSIIGTSLGFICALGLVGGAIFVVVTPYLVGHILKVPHHLIDEAKLTYYVSSGLIPVLLITSALNGVLEAYQRFDLANVLKVPSNILTSIIPVIILLFHGSLPLIVLALLVKNVFTLLIFFLFALRLSGRIKLVLENSDILRKMFNFGGWVSVISFASSIITYLDRFLIGSILSMAAVAYYTPPFEMVSKLWVIPQSLYMTLFPAFSALWTDRKHDVESLFTCACKYLILSVGPVVLILVIFAKDILSLWIGSEFAIQGTLAFQILAVGFFLNCQAWIPSTLLQAIGRPDLVGKLFLCELPLYVGVAGWLISKMGINGAALAWALKGGFEAVLFFVVSWRVTHFRLSTLLQGGVLRGFIALGMLVFIVSVFEILFHDILLVRIIITIGFITIFMLDTYFNALNGVERTVLKAEGFRLVGIKKEVK